jgi:hypothetical protein
VQKNLPSWAFGVLAVIGLSLVGSMALNWIDLGGVWTQRGFSIALDENHWLLLAPIAGIVLFLAAITRSSHTRLAALFAGIAVAGYVLLGTARSMIHSGLDTWLVLGGAGLLCASTGKDKTVARVIGGAAVLAGFFAPWADVSMFRALTSGFTSGVSSNVLWLVPVGGVLGIISAGNKENGKLAVTAGMLVFGSILFVIAMVAILVFGLGAWIALGASTLALVISVVAPAPAPVVASTQPAALPAKK